MNEQSVAATGATTPEQLSFSFVQRPGLLRITIVSFLLTLVTLGFYRFWARTHVRKHIWSSVHLNGEPLEYTGTGMELFKGFLLVFLVIILPLTLFTGFASFIYGPESPVIAIVQFVVIMAVYVLWGFAYYKAWNYKLSRTQWRGIRGALVGSAMIYSLLTFGSFMAKGMSLGWATPVMNTVLQEQITNDMRFGDAAFKFKGRAGPLYPTYALSWFLTLGAIILAAVLIAANYTFFSSDTFRNLTASGTEPSLSLIILLIGIGVVAILLFLLLFEMLWAVYTAKQMRTFADYTRFDGAPFKLDATTGSIIGLTVVNLIILIFTLGAGWPYINRRIVRYVVDRLTLEGHIDIDRISQSTAAMPTRGEGLFDAFDVGGL